MSTYDDSSLFLYPSGYKASVLFAQKPMDANGQLAFTRSNDTATRVASNGLIEKVRTNLVTYSEQFDNAAWAKTGCTVTANSSTDPIGGTTADKMVSISGNTASKRVEQTFSAVSGTTYTVSAYFKADGWNFAFFNAPEAQFTTREDLFLNLTNGSLSGSTSLGSVESVGNGWYRLRYTRIATASGSTSFRFGFSNTASISSTGDGTNGVLIWGAQLELSDFGPTPYIPTVAAAVSVGPVANIPRIDYLGGGCGKLLLEPQRTNICLWSENFDNATWVKIGTTVTANNAVSPDGYTNADALVENTATSLHDTYQAFVSSSSTAYTFSCYIKPSTRTRAYLRSDTSAGTVRTLFDLTGSGSVVTLNHTSASISLVGNGWYRCSITFTEGTGAAGRLVFVEGAVGTSINYAGNGLTAFWLYGAQLEAGSYASSYVTTLAASVTRGADLASAPYTGLTTTSGSLFIDLKKDFAGQNINSGVASLGLRLSSTGTNDSVGLRDATLGTFQGVMRVGGTSSNLGAVISGTAATKVCFVWTASTVKMFKDGALFGSASISTPAVFNTIELPNSTRTVSAPLSQFLIFPTALSDAEAIAITTL